MKTVAATIAEVLYKAGTRKVFGLPGGETVELLDELRLQGIEFILVRNESSAVFMADAYARVTGKPAVCMATLGPGAANAVMGVAHCYLDRSPVLIITAQKPDSLLSGYTHQVIDLHALFAPITKASTKVHSGNAHKATMDALALAQDGRPGPVHLQLSTDDAAAIVDTAEDGAYNASDISSIATSKQADAVQQSDLKQAYRVLSQSTRPLIVVGLGIEPQRPYTELRSLAESLHAPVIVTPKAKGAISDNHPLSAGTIGVSRNDTVYQIIEEADCILAIGFDVVELVKPWSYDGTLIWIAPWVNADPQIDAQYALVGDMSAILTGLIDSAFTTDTAWGESHVAKLRTGASSFPIPDPLPGRITPQAALSMIRDRTQADAYLAVDVGSHKIFSSLEWPSYEPNRFLVSNGLSSMSYALPATIGVIEASPSSQVVCLTGDAGLSMNLGELGVLAERNLPVLVIVLNDGAIDLIRSYQQNAGKPIYGTEFAPPRYDKIASAFGLPAQRVESNAQLASALGEFLLARRPALIEVMLDPAGYPTTPREK